MFWSVVLLSSCSLLACARDEQSSTATTRRATTTTSQPTTTGRPGKPSLLAPLTNRPWSGRGDPRRPVLVVKVDNADRLARPQAGLASADVVYEEKVEGAVTRFAAVFHSKSAPVVGPVRSARSTDLAILSQFDRPLFAYSGANARFAALIRSAPLVDVGYDRKTAAYVRDRSRRAPDNLFTSTDALWSGVEERTSAPAPLFTFGKGRPNGRKVVRVRYDFGGGRASAPVEWVWDRKERTWKRFQNGTRHVDTAGRVLTADNLILQFVAYRYTGIVDVSGAPVPEAVLDGEGDAWVFVGDKLVEARWSRSGGRQVTTWIGGDGREVSLSAGRTWVVLAERARSSWE
ncbi:MAG: hypothetical protein KatS3mg008_0419 [Acidimicrobiales bacterium]|nr:MAG: hypothetical protein KatS3mg008_0419 [Acidimicrobiales bacterium]